MAFAALPSPNKIGRVDTFGYGYPEIPEVRRIGGPSPKEPNS
jgi:hypothetical protein